MALLHRLQHKYVIKMLDYFEEPDRCIIVMERPEKYIDLFDYITQKEYLTERTSRYLFRFVYVHALKKCILIFLHKQTNNRSSVVLSVNGSRT